jgi:hypothetical protein
VTDLNQDFAPLLEAWAKLDDGLDAEFAALLPVWTQVEAHKRLLKQMQLRGILPSAGKRYAVAAKVRRNDAVVDEARQSLIALAMASMQHAPAPEPSAKPGRFMLAFVLFGMCALALGGMRMCIPHDASPMVNE